MGTVRVPTEHSAFVRWLEQHYASAVAQLRARGVSDAEAHRCAFEGTKSVGRHAVAELRRAGLSPDAGPVPALAVTRPNERAVGEDPS